MLVIPPTDGRKRKLQRRRRRVEATGQFPGVSYARPLYRTRTSPDAYRRAKAA